MKTSSAKAKGRRLQKWVCDQIAKIINLPTGKDCPIESRPMGQSGVDVRLDKEALKLFPWSIECKNQEKWAIHQWIEQARKNKLKNTNWLLICSRNRRKPVVILDAEVFFGLFLKKRTIRRKK